MQSVEYRSPIGVSQQELFAWHERDGAFERLVPPWEDICVIEKKGGIRDGDETTLSVKLGPIRKKWVARHFGYEPPRKFQDEQVEGPFKSEVHTHLCLPDPDGAANRSILVDHIDYEPPLGSDWATVCQWYDSQEFRSNVLFSSSADAEGPRPPCSIRQCRRAADCDLGCIGFDRNGPQGFPSHRGSSRASCWCDIRQIDPRAKSNGTRWLAGSMVMRWKVWTRSCIFRAKVLRQDGGPRSVNSDLSKAV